MDSTCWTIIGAMGTAIAGMATFIKMLWSDLKECQKARVQALQDQLSLVRVASKEIDPDKNNGGAP